jgi:hypothetical protein
MKLEQDNDLFQLTHNKKEGCHDFTLKKASYDTTTELAGMISWIHQLGVNMPDVKIRLGAMVEKGIVVDAKPKIE